MVLQNESSEGDELSWQLINMPFYPFQGEAQIEAQIPPR